MHYSSSLCNRTYVMSSLLNYVMSLLNYVMSLLNYVMSLLNLRFGESI